MIWRKFGKALAALAVAVLTVLAAMVSDGRVDQAEGVQLAIAVVTAAGVYLVPILPAWPWAKTGIAVLLAVLNVATSLITDGLTGAEVINLVLAGLGVLAVGAAPARSVGQVRPPVVPLR